MRISTAVILATILGVATGAGVAALRIAVAPWDGDPEGVRRASSALQVPGGPEPKVVVDHEQYNFGTMDVDAEAKHDFTFTNRGQAPLVLSAGDTSCGCTLSEIEGGRMEIAPGESNVVTVKWTANKGEGPFTQTATIETNDPIRPRMILTVSGRITRVVRPVPSELVLGQVSAGRPVTGQVRLLCYLEEPLEVRACEPVEEQTAEHFEVTFEPLPADQLQQESEAGDTSGKEEEKKGETGKTKTPQSGYLLTITVKPGLPLGVFRQTILVKTNLESIPTVKVPVMGTVVGDISIYGRGWDAENSLLTLGTISRQEGALGRLLLVTRGPLSKEVQFELVRADPEDLLQVDQQRLQEATAIGSGTATQTPLIIRIPKGSRRANYLGPQFGEIRIKTNHPEIPELRIHVRFAVEG